MSHVAVINPFRLAGSGPPPGPIQDSLTRRSAAVRDSITNLPSIPYWGQFDPLYMISGTPNATTALRFTNITIPQGATILDARLTVWTNLNQSNVSTAWMTVGAEQVDNASQLSSAANHESRKGNLGTTLQWGPHAGLAGSNLPFQSPNLAAIVQQIVNRGGWASGNAIQFFTAANPATTIDYQYRSFWEGLADFYPRLVINFEYTP